MDFVSDALIDGRAIRILTVIDDATRVCVGLVAGYSFTGLRLAETLDRLVKQRGAYPSIFSLYRGYLPCTGASTALLLPRSPVPGVLRLTSAGLSSLSQTFGESSVLCKQLLP